MLNPQPVATLCSSFSRENGYLLLICSSLSTSQLGFSGDFFLGVSFLAFLSRRTQLDFQIHPGVFTNGWNPKSWRWMVQMMFLSFQLGDSWVNHVCFFGGAIFCRPFCEDDVFTSKEVGGWSNYTATTQC